ncbi:MAG: alkaline phosphatase family protein [Nanoarchaeota archaeon]|nr:alkaline phosphatase family protein [Nanoarchaeota archaeon]MBU1269515.1 alkaline phosphatase family protein [Nanoarchaeota archaeon]MBU1604287.1 alkaline phosphatase family protein [Nanoarchaeota archaeon]MBU2443671.1 alkaline phosphatase family protein [Nanoarchaeota archaeon]
MSAKLLVIGIDAATWTVIDKNIDSLPTFKKLKKEAKNKALILDQKPYSAPCWTSMFTGLKEEEHKHHEFVVDNILQTREDINANFIWDILTRRKKKVKALNIPFIVPPYNFNIDFKVPGAGVGTTTKEWNGEIKEVTKKSVEILRKEDLDLFIVCYTILDKIQHLHWGEEIVLEYYKKIDSAIRELTPHGEKLIIISDHGFCSFGEARVQTLPRKTKTGKELKGDHHEEAILITKGINTNINNLRDVFKAIKNEFRN